MKLLLALLTVFISFQSIAKPTECSYKDRFSVKKVVMEDKILLEDVSKLYSKWFFEERMVASEKKTIAKSKKKNWSEGLRAKIKPSDGKFINFL